MDIKGILITAGVTIVFVPLTTLLTLWTTDRFKNRKILVWRTFILEKGLTRSNLYFLKDEINSLGDHKVLKGIYPKYKGDYYFKIKRGEFDVFFSTHEFEWNPNWFLIITKTIDGRIIAAISPLSEYKKRNFLKIKPISSPEYN